MDDYSVSKRDKRRNNIATRLRSLNEGFDSERDAHYNKMLYTLQTSLYELHNSKDPEFIQQLADLEEERDNRLTELALWEQYQLEQAQLQNKEDTESAMASYEHMMQLVKEKLRTRLETQRKQLSEDRSLLDVSNDHTFFLQAANPGAPPSRNIVGRGNGINNLSSAERRSLRRRGRNADDLTADDISGISGSEAPSSRRARSGTSRNQGNSSGPDSDAGTTSAAAGTDALDSVLRDFERPQQRHITKSYQGVKTLKQDEGMADIAQISDAERRLKRTVGY